MIRVEWTEQEASAVERVLADARLVLERSGVRDCLPAPRGESALELAHAKLVRSIEIGEGITA